MKRSAILLLFIMSLLVPILFLGCGSDGSDGSSGFTSLASTSPEPAGDNCANGGTNRITSYNVCYTKLLRWGNFSLTLMNGPP